MELEPEPEPPPNPRFPAQPPTKSLSPPPPPPIPCCDPCRKAQAECKRTSDICDRCIEQGLLCKARFPPPPTTCELRMPNPGRTSSLVENFEKLRACSACQTKNVYPGNELCGICKAKVVKPVRPLPTSRHTTKKETQPGSRTNEALKSPSAVRACLACCSAGTRCDEGKLRCSHCHDKSIECRYSGLLSSPVPMPGLHSQQEATSLAFTTAKLNVTPPTLPTPRSRCNPKACILCRRHLAKCDQERPSCAYCIKLNRVCAYEDAMSTPQSEGRSNSESPNGNSPSIDQRTHICDLCRDASVDCTGFPDCARCVYDDDDCHILSRGIKDIKSTKAPTATSACEFCQYFPTKRDLAKATCSGCGLRRFKSSYQDEVKRNVPAQLVVENEPSIEDQEVPVHEDFKVTGNKHDKAWPSNSSREKMGWNAGEPISLSKPVIHGPSKLC